MKYCPSCKTNKKKEEFYKSVSNHDGLYAYCKKCAREKNRVRSNQINRKRYKEDREFRDKIRENAKKYKRDTEEAKEMTVKSITMKRE